MTLLDPNKSLMKKFIKVFLLSITSIILTSCTTYLDEIPQWKLNEPDKWIGTPIYDQNSKLMPEVEGLKVAKKKYEDLLNQAENSPMEWEDVGTFNTTEYFYIKKVPESQKQYIRDRIKELDAEIYNMENKNRTEAEEDDYLDEANKELELFDFGDNNNKNKFDDVENQNENIFQSPQTPSTPETPSMPETFSFPGSSYEGG